MPPPCFSSLCQGSPGGGGGVRGGNNPLVGVPLFAKGPSLYFALPSFVRGRSNFLAFSMPDFIILTPPPSLFPGLGKLGRLLQIPWSRVVMLP